MNVGETLAHYLLEAEVGSGGMGVVYRARDLRLDRTVAIKLLAARLLADETARARLMREARLTSALNHPHICTVYEVGEAEGTVYLALEWVRGLTLHDILAGEPLPIETVLRCGGQIADALDHAHAHGVIHRDLKSANVIVTPEGRVKVLDFGLARRSADGPTTSPGETPQQLKLTTEGMMVGTPFAIAPEVLRGADGDERGDLWALGVLLYEMVTGVLPFQGRTPVELGSSILHDPLPALPARVPAGIRMIIQRCLAKEPVQRYQRASEVRAALETVESGESSRPGATEPSPRDARPRVPRRVWQVAAGVGVLALALGAIMTARGVPGMETPRVRSLAVLPLENLSGD
ncbi:MAG TPA: serine/threonine-protein kinase, partial [Candidatus Limnocylindria bacterium]|nr:serine/threonine-protein kinase [Candidatus Limnocylindria bacterium]